MADQSPMKPGWMTTSEICREFGITEGNLRHWRDSLGLRTQPSGIGKALVYWQEDIDQRLRPALEKARARGKPRGGTRNHPGEGQEGKGE